MMAKKGAFERTNVCHCFKTGDRTRGTWRLPPNRVSGWRPNRVSGWRPNRVSSQAGDSKRQKTRALITALWQESRKGWDVANFGSWSKKARKACTTTKNGRLRSAVKAKPRLNIDQTKALRRMTKHHLYECRWNPDKYAPYVQAKDEKQQMQQRIPCRTSTAATATQRRKHGKSIPHRMRVACKHTVTKKETHNGHSFDCP